jgi:TIR domain
MRIFLSYRREDASAWAGRLRDALAAQFGEENVFQDVATVRPGQRFTDAIDVALSRSDVALAVIGPRWFMAAGDDGEPRLAKSDDYVRAELMAALAHTKQVIPVLVGGGDDAHGRNASRGP